MLGPEAVWFLMWIVSFLGFRASADGFQPDPAEIEAIQTWHLHIYTLTDAQKFVSLASCYRKFHPWVRSHSRYFDEIVQEREANRLDGSGRDSG